MADEVCLIREEGYEFGVGFDKGWDVFGMESWAVEGRPEGYLLSSWESIILDELPEVLWAGHPGVVREVWVFEVFIEEVSPDVVSPSMSVSILLDAYHLVIWGES